MQTALRGIWNTLRGSAACTEKCPAKKTPDTFNELTGNTTAITIAFPQAIPKKAVINPQFCRQLLKGKCGVCAKVCPTGAIKYDMEDEVITEEVGSIVAATGYDLMDWTVYKEYGGGAYPDVITSLQYERLLSASGPTGGHVKRPSDGREPKNIVFVQCVGSRDKSVGRPYCSGFCCMYTAKQAILTKDHIPDSKSFVFYMDIRAPGKMYDEFTRRAMEEYGTEYIRGRVSQIYPDGNGQMTVMARPSHTAIAGNCSGVPPDIRTPALTASARLFRCICPGTTSLAAFTIPIRGRSISSLVRPRA